MSKKPLGDDLAVYRGAVSACAEAKKELREAGGPALGAGTASCSPSLVYNGQESISKSPVFKSQWDRQQRRIYSKLQSFTVLKSSEGYQLFRVDLTTGIGGNAGLMSAHALELVKRVGRVFGYSVEYFWVRTAEGHGVMHGVWAVKHEKAVYIPQVWLSSQWEEIHGAHRVWIKRISTKGHLKNAVRYLVNQYLANQSSIVRCSYSWNKCKVSLGRGWSSFKKIISSKCPVLRYERLYGRDVAIRDWLPMRSMITMWQSLLTHGLCIFGDDVIEIVDRDVVMVPSRWQVYA
jgi:hypothetical protein